MSQAHVRQRPAVGSRPETPLRIRAVERKLYLPRELVPQLLESNGAIAVSLQPKLRHHFTKGAYTSTGAAGAPDDACDGGLEEMGSRRAADHEFRQHFV